MSQMLQPRPLSLQDYDRAVTEIRAFFATFDSISGVYQYGTLKAPGLSDIDLLVALPDDFADPAEARRMAQSFPIPEGFEGLLSTGSFKVLPERVFRRVNWLGPLQTRVLLGRDLERENVPENRKTEFEICLVLDWFAERLGTVLRHRLSPIRSPLSTIGDLYSFYHSFRRAEALLTRAPSDLAAQLDELRSRWFEQSEAENQGKLSNLLDIALTRGFELIWEFADFLEERHGFASNRNASGGNATELRLNRGMTLVFDSDRRGALVRSREDSEEDRVRVHVPLAWESYLGLKSEIGGPVSEILRRNWCGRPQPEPASPLTLVARERMLLINDLYEFTLRSGFSRGQLYRYGHVQPVETAEARL